MEISKILINGVPTINNLGAWGITPGLEANSFTFTMLDSDVDNVKGWGITLEMIDNSSKGTNKLTFKNLVVGQRYPTKLDYNNLYSTKHVLQYADIDLMDSRHWLKFGVPVDSVGNALWNARREWNTTKEVYYEYNYKVFEGNPEVIYKSRTLKWNGTSYQPYTIKDIFEDVLSVAVKTANEVSGVKISYTIDIPKEAVTSTYGGVTSEYPIFNNIIIPPEYSNYQAMKFLLALPECQNYVFGVNPDGNWFLTYRKDVRTKPLDKTKFNIISGEFGRIDRRSFRPEKVKIAFPVQYEVEYTTYDMENVIRADSYGEDDYAGSITRWGPGEFVERDTLFRAWKIGALTYTNTIALIEAYASQQFNRIPPVTPATQEEARIKNIKKACLDQDYYRTFRLPSSCPLPMDPTRPISVKCAFFGVMDRNTFLNEFKNYSYADDVLGTSDTIKKSVLTVKDIGVNILQPVEGIFQLTGLGRNSGIRFNCHQYVKLQMTIAEETHLIVPATQADRKFWVKYYTQPIVESISDLYVVDAPTGGGGVPGTVVYYNAGRAVQMKVTIDQYGKQTQTIINDKTVNSLINIISDRIRIELSDNFVGDYQIERLHKAAELGETGGTGEGLLPQDWTKIENISWSISAGRCSTSIKFFRRIVPDETWKTKRILEAVRKSIARNFGDPYRY